jgi:undecaprenyl-diphosphatase
VQRLSVWLKTGDHWLFNCVNQKLICSFFDWLMPKITIMGSATFSVVMCLLFLAVGTGTHQKAAAESLLALGGSQLIVYIIKRMAGRQRPYLALPDVRTISSLFTDHSFPSGHTAAAFSLAVAFVLHFPAYEFVLFAIAGLVGISRLYLGQHYPTDVLIGAVLGSLSSILVHQLALFSWFIIN